ncbi:MAG: hypothetical protein Q9187_008299 [Circinaria calcarea]
MLFLRSLLATALAFSASAVQAQAKSVFAHFMVGNVYSYTPDTWAEDIQLAKDAHIDGFALNIGADTYTDKQLGYAYDAAEKAGGFSLFISFDFGNHPWTTQEIQSKASAYSNRPAQFKLEGNEKAVVSTFEGGHSEVTDWTAIANQFSLIPSWSNLGEKLEHNIPVSGAFAWDAWPIYPSSKDTTNDQLTRSMLGNKPYMMPVSPWFYANCYDKNWLWSGDNLWHERWQQVIEFQPELVEIITWNDYGESHYVGPLRDPSGIPQGAEAYVKDMPHDAWRELLPYYIDTYKNGNTTMPEIPKVKVVYAHRPNPSFPDKSGGTIGNNPAFGQQAFPPEKVSQDLISLNVLVDSPASVSVQIGNNAPTQLSATNRGINHFSVPFNGQTGAVTYTVTSNGQTMLKHVGAAITNQLLDTKGVNWNAIVGSASS